MLIFTPYYFHIDNPIEVQMASNKASNRRVLLISLNYKGFFDEMFGALLTELSDKAQIQRVKTATSAIRKLSAEPSPSAVLVTDEALCDESNAHVWEAILQYVRQGGTSVIMGHFSSFAPSKSFKTFFARAGLQWEDGSYHRTTFVVNGEAVGHELATKLPAQYSQKAVFVNNVARQDSWYLTDEKSVVESNVFAPSSAHANGETAVAFAGVGEGKLGYVGDVNAEEGSDAVILAMCGLLD
jgi:hypothetical protein